jgi:hypothetical protein
LPVFFTDSDLVFFFQAAVLASRTLSPCPVIHLPLFPRIWTLIVFLAISRHLGAFLYIRKSWSTIGRSDKEKLDGARTPIGTDAVLAQTRKLILEMEGHSVISVTDEKSLASSCELYAFDVAVLGQALSANIKRRAADLIRQHCPNVKLLELHFRAALAGRRGLMVTSPC